MASLPGYTVVTGHAQMDLQAVHAFLCTTYWSPGIAFERVARAARHSLCFGVRHDRDQIAYARVITDHATFAYLADVYVLPEHRGRGISRLMLDAVFAHPDLQDLRRTMLVTRDAHGLYQRYGFTALAHPDRVMERHRPYATPTLPAGPARSGVTGSDSMP